MRLGMTPTNDPTGGFLEGNPQIWLVQPTPGLVVIPYLSHWRVNFGAGPWFNPMAPDSFGGNRMADSHSASLEVGTLTRAANLGSKVALVAW